MIPHRTESSSSPGAVASREHINGWLRWCWKELHLLLSDRARGHVFCLRFGSLSLSLSYLQRGAYFLFLWLPPRAGMRRLCRRNTSLHSSQPCNIYLCINKVFFSFLISLLVLVLLTLAHAHPPLWNRTPADDTQITLIFSPSLCIYNITYASIIYTKKSAVRSCQRKGSAVVCITF